MIRLVLREIRANFGRWFAILAIIALGTGFLAGLMQTAPAMLQTMREYVRESRLYDWRAVMPDGFDGALLDEASSVRGVRAAEGAVGDEVLRAHSITERVNLLTLHAGRLPERAGECVADSKAFTADALGTTVRLSAKNSGETREKFAFDEYTIVGIAASPIYINYERGNSTEGSGTVRAFLYLPREGFHMERDTELYLTLDTEAEAYTDAYDRILRLTQRRLLRFAEESFSSGETENAYVVNRKGNVGYSSFESDAGIVEGIARVFPLFFFLVAALVCVTTMTRMVIEQRTQIGVLRALGFGTGKIAGIYLLYSGSAALLGCILGFLSGSLAIPRVIWQAYNIMYQQGALRYRPDWRLGAELTAGFLTLSCSATYLVFHREDREMPAQLLRPRQQKAGRRSLLERLPALGRHIGLSGKATLRNLLRDYGRLLMTVTGIAGCTALLLAAYGIKDSIGGIVSAQFDEVVRYDYLVAFSGEPDAEALRDFAEGPGHDLSQWQLLYQGNMDIVDGDVSKSAIVVASPEGTLDALVDLHRGGEKITYPQSGEAVIGVKVAEVFGLSAGDALTLRSADGEYLELTVSGVFDNYFYHYVVLSADTFTDQWGELPEMRMMFARAAEGADIHRTAAELLGCDGVLSVVVSEDTAARVDNMMTALNYIVYLVIVCSGALAFIVVYNMTDMNIIERIREIATVKVLGFTPHETAAYVFRENIVLTAFGVLAGLPLGKLLHAFVIHQINVDMIHFELRILPESYFYAVALTFFFVAVVDGFMYLRLERIRMAEALKSIE